MWTLLSTLCFGLVSASDSLYVLEKTPLQALNQAQAQYFAHYHAPSQTLYYTVRQAQKPDEDLYQAKRIGKQWDSIAPLPRFQTLFNEGTPSLSSAGDYLVFSACDYPGGMGSCDLYESKAQAGQWGTAKNLGYFVNSREWDGQVYLSKSGKLLIFASERYGGLGGKDLYFTQRNPQGQWERPIPFPAPINSPYDEQGPTFLEDRQILVFSSDRPGGAGGLDFYQSLREQGKWSMPQPIKGLNSPRNEVGFAPAWEKDLFIITQNQGQGALQEALYVVRLDEKQWLRPSPSPVQAVAPALPKRPWSFEDIRFENNAWQIPMPAPQSLLELVQYLKAESQQKVLIEGHTDDTGQSLHNQQLSEKRAEAVKAFLIQSGIAAERIQSKGYGNTRPKNKENPALNRRIEIRLL